MAQGTQRLRYFDGQFLRSGDFTDEQSYHVAARRQLNLEMGLTGIVSGAGIQIDQNSVPPAPPQTTPDSAASGAASSSSAGVEFLSLGTGYVIDQLGREIQISAPTSLTPLLSRAGLKLGPNELWIVYTETASGSPAPGYQLCNELSQNTRWTESFNLILRPLSVAPDPNAPDPNRDLMGVCLGIVMVTSGGAGPSFLLPPHWWHRRRYAGIRAQRIIAPDQLGPDPFIFDGQLAQPNNVPPGSYIGLKTPHGVYAHGNMLVQNNALIGDDFELYNDGTPANAGLPTSFKDTGNLKVSGDLFLQGKFYNDTTGSWLDLDTYIGNLLALPDIQLATIPLTGLGLQATPTPTPQGSTTVTTKLASYKQWPTVLPFIASFSFVTADKIQSYVVAGNPAAVQDITFNPAVVTAGGGPDQANIQITCNIGQGFPVGPDYGFLIDSITIGLIVIFQPSSP